MSGGRCFPAGLRPINATAVLWFFQREDDRLRCEIRRALGRPGFELLWTSTDGQVRVEYADDPTVLTARRQTLEDQLRLDGWEPVDHATPFTPA